MTNDTVAKKSKQKIEPSGDSSEPKPTLKPGIKKSIKSLNSGIYHSDCVTGMKCIDKGSVDLVFADPPFNIGYKYDVYEDQMAASEYLSWSKEWMAEVYRVLKDDGSFWLAIGDDFAAELKLKAQDLGFHCRSWVIWYYTFGVNCKYKFTRSHTHLFYFVKDVENFTFHSEDLDNRIPSARMLVYNDKRTNPKGRLPDDTWIIPPDVPATFALRPQDMRECFLPNESDWYFPRVAGTFKERAGFHGCQMPEQLLGRIVRCCSSKDEVVLDPFSGSASTLVVSKKLNRRHLAFELSKDYVKAGTERLKSTTAGEPLTGAPEPKMSALPTWKESQGKGRQPARSSGSKKQNEDSDQTVASVTAVAEALEKALPKQASVSEELQRAMQRAALQALAAVADEFSIAELQKKKKAQKAFQKQCEAVGLPTDAEANLKLLQQAFQDNGQLF